MNNMRNSIDNHDSAQKVTLRHVADDAGVSRSTVSLVLRNSPLVAEETRQRILKSIEKLGYVYNRGAASLRTNRTHIVGLIVTDITTPFYAELTSGVETELNATGYITLFANTMDALSKQERLLELMQEHRVDGVLLCPAKGTTPEVLESLSRHLPTVMIVRYLREAKIDFVGADDVKAGELAANYLISHGHRKIAFIGGPSNSSTRQDRLRGYENSLHQHNIEIDTQWLIPTPATRNGGYQAIQQLLDQHGPPTACICYNDVVAFGASLGLQAMGCVPGKDFAVMGFDDIAEAGIWQPPLTTIAIEPRRIGAIAANLLMERVNQPDAAPRQLLLPVRLIERKSCNSVETV